MMERNGLPAHVVRLAKNGDVSALRTVLRQVVVDVLDVPDGSVGLLTLVDIIEIVGHPADWGLGDAGKGNT